jgi:hypothetical protein
MLVLNPTFCQLLVAVLWRAMTKTGKGYHRRSLRHTGVGVDRRHDKLQEVVYEDSDGTTRFEPVERDEGKLQRAARLGRLTVRH